MSEEMMLIVSTAVMAGMLLGRWWAGWAIWGYIYSKTPDVGGWRTAFHLRGKFYYVVTEREYVNNVMGPLPDGSRVEIGDNYTRFSHNMPPRH
jgi:hypothetical protein